MMTGNDDEPCLPSLGNMYRFKHPASYPCQQPIEALSVRATDISKAPLDYSAV
jgi:hypothetical protein